MCSNLENLSLSIENTYFADVGAQYLIKAISKLKQLKGLTLYYSDNYGRICKKMTEKGYSYLQECISNKESKLLELNTNLYIINIEKVLHSSGLESISLGRV